MWDLDQSHTGCRMTKETLINLMFNWIALTIPQQTHSLDLDSDKNLRFIPASSPHLWCLLLTWYERLSVCYHFLGKRLQCTAADLRLRNRSCAKTAAPCVLKLGSKCWHNTGAWPGIGFIQWHGFSVLISALPITDWLAVTSFCTLWLWQAVPNTPMPCIDCLTCWVVIW